MIEVDGPDGTIVEFPDGTDQSIILEAMGRKFGRPENTTPKEEGRTRGIEMAQSDMFPDMALTGLNRAGQALTFGTSDEIGAALSAAWKTLVDSGFQGSFEDFGKRFQESYDLRQGLMSANAQEFNRQNPKQAIVTDILGGLPAGAAGVGRGTAAQMVGRGALTGGSLGGLTAFATGDRETPEETLRDTALGTAIGVGLGAAIPAAGEGVKRAVKAVAGSKGDSLTKAVARAEIPDNIADDQFVAEALGEEGRRMAVAVAGKGGQASEIAEAAISERAATRQGALRKVFAENITRTRGVDALNQIRSAEAAAKPIFNKSDNLRLPVTPALRELVRNADAMDVKYPAKSGEQSLKALADDADVAYGSVRFGDIRQLTRNLEDQAGKAFRSGAGNEGADASNAARSLRRFMRESNPSYAKAAKMWRSEHLNREAFSLGQKALRAGADNEFALEDFIKDAPAQSEINAFLSGVLDAVETRTQDGSRLIKPAGISKRLSLVLGPENANRVVSGLERARKQAGFENTASRRVNSATEIRMKAETGLESGIKDVAANLIEGINPADTLKAAANRVRQVNPKDAARLAKIMFGKPSDFRKFLDSVQAYQAKMAKLEEGVAKVIDAPAIGAAAGASQAANRLD